MLQFINGDVVKFEDADLNLCTHIHPFLKTANTGRGDFSQIIVQLYFLFINRNDYGYSH